MQLFIGYEWFMSGLTKIVRSGFPPGLAFEQKEKAEGAVSWYKSFLDRVVIPNATAFGLLVEIGELLIGTVMIAAAVIWLVRREQFSFGRQTTILVTVAVANLAGIFMNVNFHPANGSPHPWLIPKSGFDEDVYLDSLMPAIQLILVGVSIRLLLLSRHRSSGVATDDVPAAHDV